MTQKQRVLAKLMDCPGIAFSFDLAEYCLQYNARIHELRRLGFDIVSKKRLGYDGFQLRTPHDQIDFKNCKLRVQ